MSKHHLQDCRHGKDFQKYVQAEENHSTDAEPVEFRWGKGDHFIVKTSKGMEIIPVCHELGNGLRNKIAKRLMAIGFLASLLIFVLPVVVSNL